MPTDRLNDLKAFIDFAHAAVAHASSDITLDEALDLWQFENASERERNETLRAIQRGLDDMRARRTVDAFESAELLRQRIDSIDSP